MLELGADASLHNVYGQTALDLTEMNGKHETAQLLRTPDPELLTRGTPGHARRCVLTDAALPPGTRLRADPHVDGTCLRWERQSFGPNNHFVRFDGAEAEQPVQLKALEPAAWSVLPLLPASVVAAGGAIEEGQPPEAAAPAARPTRRGGGWCCSAPAAAQ